jgi:hypothetical protein
VPASTGAVRVADFAACADGAEETADESGAALRLDGAGADFGGALGLEAMSAGTSVGPGFASAFASGRGSTFVSALLSTFEALLDAEAVLGWPLPAGDDPFKVKVLASSGKTTPQKVESGLLKSAPTSNCLFLRSPNHTTVAKMDRLPLAIFRVIWSPTLNVCSLTSLQPLPLITIVRVFSSNGWPDSV